MNTEEAYNRSLRICFYPLHPLHPVQIISLPIDLQFRKTFDQGKSIFLS